MKLLEPNIKYIELGNYLGTIDWTSVACFSSMFSLLCGLATNTLRGSLAAVASRRRGEETSPGAIGKILWIGATSLLWSQSHNLNQSAIPVNLCLPHFYIIGFYPSNCCSLLLWHTVPHLSHSAYGISLSLLYLSFFFFLAKTPCFCLQALCCNSSKCPGYQYFISKYISLLAPPLE